MFIKKFSIALGCIVSCGVMAAPNPASQDWVQKQLELVSTKL